MKPPVFRVITIKGHALSEAAADRCIASALPFGYQVEKHYGWTPADDPIGTMKGWGWPTAKFTRNKYSRPAPCAACFLSHASLWTKAVDEKQKTVILEHDAIFVREFPDWDHCNGVVNFGRPSFGRFKQPPSGIGPLVSGPHFKGAHAYSVTPYSAGELLRLAKTEAEPADCFLSLARFQFLREAYPWPVVCEDSFTTVQAAKGCFAKHRPVTIVGSP